MIMHSHWACFRRVRECFHTPTPSPHLTPPPYVRCWLFATLNLVWLYPIPPPIPIPTLEFSVTGYLYPREQNPELSQPYIVPYHDDGFDS